MLKRVSESIKEPTTCFNAFLRAFWDASSTVEPKPLVITVFKLLLDAIKLSLEFIFGKINFFGSEYIGEYKLKIQNIAFIDMNFINVLIFPLFFINFFY